MPDQAARLDQQIAFLIEADRLKTVERSNILMDGSRPENSAEHSWHVCLWALVLAPDNVPLMDVLSMLILHDLVEIDAGDHPIHLPAPEQGAAEARAAKRLFGLLPGDQGARLAALWAEFEAGATPAARFAKIIDHAQPILQVLDSPAPRTDHLQIVQDNLRHGRAADLAECWPEGAAQIHARLTGTRPPAGDLSDCLAFLAEADLLKSVVRATYLADASRLENSAEHSWHLTLFALILGEHAGPDVHTLDVIKMLILHDLVEIDAGDVPIFAAAQAGNIAAEETAAAERIFGLLPNELGCDLHVMWQRFEARACATSRFAKALDRFQPPMLNLAAGGGSWADYNVDCDAVFARVGPTIAEGAPALWDYAAPRIAAFFDRTPPGSALAPDARF